MRKRLSPLLVLGAILILGMFTVTLAQDRPIDTAAGNVVKITKVLPANGAPRLLTFEASGDAIILEVMIDNTPTGSGVESDYRVLGMTVGGSYLHPGGPWPASMAENDMLAIRPFFAWMGYYFLHFLPVNAGDKVRMGFDTQNGLNDVTLEITVCYIGGPATIN